MDDQTLIVIVVIVIIVPVMYIIVKYVNNKEEIGIDGQPSAIEMKSEAFRFWWPASEGRIALMRVILLYISILLFAKGYKDENLDSYSNPSEFVIVFLTYSVFGVVGWYFIINIGRFLLHCDKRRIETKPERDETQREIDELETLRRRTEIKRLKKELGEDDNNDKDNT